MPRAVWQFAAVACALCCGFFASSTDARITRVVLERIESPAFGGASFGPVGQYEKLVGRAYGEIDPAHEANRGIVYIDKARPNAYGRVEYSFDFYILKPIDMRRGNRTIFYDAVDRGDQRAFAVFHVGARPGNDPVNAADAGDGFLLKQGYTIVASGWQGDVPGGNHRLTGQYPVVSEPDGRRVTKLITAELMVMKPAYTVGLGFDGERAIQSYPALAAKMSEARLMRRAGPTAEREPIPNSEWSFGVCPEGRDAHPSNEDVCYPAAFWPDYIYDLVYTARDPVVMGIGFASTRDLVSFLRHERTDTNPVWARRGARDGRDPILHAIGFGRSRSGRYMKDLVREGFNADESRRVVFDGILPLVSGSWLTNINIEFAVPDRMQRVSHVHAGDRFAHSYAASADGKLGRCTAQEACPKIMHADTASEAYGAQHSLVVTDALGTADLPMPENVRLYFLPGTQHVPGNNVENRGVCKHAQNPNPYRETLRALLVAMRNWIVDGAEPPPSRYANLAEGTLVSPLPDDGFAFPPIPGITYAGMHHEVALKDSAQPGPDTGGASYRILVSTIDADGNDVAGVRSVTLQAPLGTYTGWNERRDGLMEGELCGNRGSFFPFAKTAAERGDDPRPSLEERYGDRAGYVAKVEEAAQALVGERFLLPEDAERLIAEAKQRDLGF